jgi:YbbR domain-containing protein
MKNHLLNNWQAKLISFLVALLVWLYLKNQIEPGFVDQLWTGTLSTGR